MNNQQTQELNVDEILRKSVKTIFKKFDEDCSEFLEKEEVEKMLLSSITMLNYPDAKENDYKKKWKEVFPQKDFDELFKTVDSDGSGTVTEEELLVFVKKIGHL